MHKKRLTRTADLMDVTVPKTFGLDTWCTCKTVGCAVGCSAMDPWFRRRGLTLKKYNGWIYDDKVDHETCTGKTVHGTLYVPMYKGDEGDAAVQAFFDLSYEEMEYLFYASEYPKENATFPKEVAKRIRKFIADTEAWDNRPWASE